MIRFGSKQNPKYINFVYGSEWDKHDFKLVGFRKTSLGWDFNLWRFMITYDNYSKVVSDVDDLIRQNDKLMELCDMIERETGKKPVVLGSKETLEKMNERS